MGKNHRQWLYGRVDEEGRLTFDDPAAFARVRGALRGRDVQMLVEPKRKPRSLAENNYYWGVVIPIISEWSGFTPEETHLALREHFLCEFDRTHGLMRMKSTADLSTVDFEKYMSNIRMWASDNGLFIPLPNESIY